MAAGFTSIRSNPLGFLEQVRLRYGDLVAFPVPGSPALLVSDPEAVRGILQGNARRWTKNTVQYAALATVTGPGLLAVSDDRWLGRRRAAQPAFHHGRLGTIGESVATAAATVVGSWRGLPASGPTSTWTPSRWASRWTSSGAPCSTATSPSRPSGWSTRPTRRPSSWWPRRRPCRCRRGCRRPPTAGCAPR